jgi:MFS family permease
MEPSRQNLLLARWAVALAFFLHGVTTGSWAPYIPLLQQKLGLPTNTLGMALFAVPLGAVASLSVASYLISRYGSSLITRVALIPLCLSVYFATAAPSLPALVLGALSYGFLRGILDISMNTHGLLIENKLKKHIVASLHGCWSIGLLSGGALATTLFRVASPDIHRMVSLSLSLCLALLVMPFLLSAKADKGVRKAAAFAWPTKELLPLGVFAFVFMILNTLANDWSGVFLKTIRHSDLSTAAFGFSAFAGLMAAARFAGDWLRSRFSTATIFFASALSCSAGAACAILIPNQTAAIVGFSLIGLGVANSIPLAYITAGNRSKISPAHGIAAVGNFGYLGTLLSSISIGFIAQATSLPLTFLLGGIIAVVIAFLATRIPLGEKKAASPSGTIQPAFKISN